MCVVLKVLYNEVDIDITWSQCMCVCGCVLGGGRFRTNISPRGPCQKHFKYQGYNSLSSIALENEH